MTQYAKYYKQPFPVGNCFNKETQKAIESAQCGIGDENTLRLAVANADDGDLIVLAPTTITLTSQLAINKPLRFRGNATAITGDFDAELVDIELDAFSSAAEVSFESITFTQGSDDVDAIAVNNTNASAALTVRFTNCQATVFDSSADAFAIDVAHATAGSAVNLVMSGRGTEYCDAVNFAVKNASDTIEIHNMKLRDQGKASAIITSADALAAQIRLHNCQVPHELATSGGNAAQLLITNKCISLTGTTYAVVDTNDLIGSQTETII